MPKIFFPSSKPRFIDAANITQGFKKLASSVARKNKNVEAVYLFGSYAKGNAGFRSDADILVILRRDHRCLRERLGEFILEFSFGPVPADVLVYTRAEIDKALKDGNPFLRAALQGVRLV